MGHLQCCGCACTTDLKWQNKIAEFDYTHYTIALPNLNRA